MINYIEDDIIKYQDDVEFEKYITNLINNNYKKYNDDELISLNIEDIYRFRSSCLGTFGGRKCLLFLSSNEKKWIQYFIYKDEILFMLGDRKYNYYVDVLVLDGKYNKGVVGKISENIIFHNHLIKNIKNNIDGVNIPQYHFNSNYHKESILLFEDYLKILNK